MTAGELAKAWFEEVWNQRQPDAIERLLAPDVRAHLEGGCEGHCPGDFREQVYDAFLRGVPDLNIAVEQVIAQGDDAVVRWHATGTHTGELMGMAPTGRRLDFRGMSWMRVQHDKLVEGWDAWNLGGVMQSLAS